MIRATRLTKRFKGLTAVDSVSLNVERGLIFGLLGPNAAGKTTLIRMLCGTVRSDGGEVRIDDMSVGRAKVHFGYVAQHFGQYEELSVWENLKFYARMYGVKDDSRLIELLKRYALEPFGDHLAGNLSGGFQRRLALICALAHDPKVLFLDEPTAGIDPVTRKLLWDDFYELSAQGKTLFVTTHYMEEAQRCHRLAFIASGKIIARGTPETIKQALGEVRVYTTQMDYRPDLHRALRGLNGILVINQFGRELRAVARAELAVSTVEAAIATVTGQPCPLTISEPNLEDVFITLTRERAGAR